MTQRICKWYNKPFTPKPKAHWQKTCGSPECKVKQRRYENTKEVIPKPKAKTPSPKRFSVTVYNHQPIGTMVSEVAEFLRARIKTMKIPETWRAVASLTGIRRGNGHMEVTYMVRAEEPLTGVRH
ncbi:MAG: hypothetical protein DRI24_19810 [Deltaproteobacteria bacterium]|nr:MAG: hypothetical protein DRI24_19810 [Deltaproteobacteria bacterium]